MEKFFARIKLDERFTFTVSYLLISLMMGCVAISFVQLANRIFSGWNGEYVVVLVVLVSLERIFTIQKLDSFEPEHKIIYHAAEWITIAIGLKVIHYLLTGFDALVNDLASWQANLTNFFTGDYLPVLILLAITWWISGNFTIEMEELRVDHLDIRWEVGILENRRQDARSAMINRIFWLGFVMIFAAILTRLDIAALFGPYLALQAPAANVLIYFLSALLLFSQTQFSLLRGRWLWHQTSIPQTIGKKWLKYGFVFLLTISVLAFLLPTQYTFGLLDVMRFLISLIIQIVLLVSTMIALPFGWLLSLLPGSKPVDEPLQPSDFANFLNQAGNIEPDPTLQLIQTILAWVFFTLLAVFSIRHFIRQNSEFFRNFRLSIRHNWLASFLISFWKWLRQGYSSLVEVIASTGTHLRGVTRTTAQRVLQRLPNFQNLTPRQRVIFFYTRLLERANESGIPRQSFETPSQFSAVLEQKIPENHQAVEGLTHAFEDARYSRHEIPPQASHQARQFWNRIVKSLRARKNPPA